MALADRFKLSLSPDDIRARYEQERRKRERAASDRIYRELPPEPREERAAPMRPPRTVRSEVAIVGAGFAGLLQAIHLRKSGIEDVVLIEKGSDVGGTWYWNRYPGIACDIESYSYLPLLDETGYIPKERFSRGEEILAYCRLLAERYGLYDRIVFDAQVSDAVWDDAQHVWTVTTDQGDAVTARFVVVAGGVLHKAKLPVVAGSEKFRGRMFHTTGWDYDYTGGSPEGFLDGLVGKRVGVIGTGATAVQVVPRVAEAAEHLYVFQRTPSAVTPRGNRPTDPAWASALAPGWQRERLNNFLAIASGRRPAVDLVRDGWTRIFLNDGADRAAGPEELAAAAELADMENMEEVRAHIDAVVQDRRTAEALKPWYGKHCKRPCWHDSYLETFNRDNVTLVDTDGRGIDRITETGIVAGGVEYELDLIVFASGFEILSDYTRRMGFDPVGRAGQRLSEAWRARARTLHGVTIPEFPNMFVVGALQGAALPNFVQMIDYITRHIARLVDWAVTGQVASLEPTGEAADGWVGKVADSVRGYQAYNAMCTPAYTNNEGHYDETVALGRTAWMGAPDDYLRMIDRWFTEDMGRDLRTVRIACRS